MRVRSEAQADDDCSGSASRFLLLSGLAALAILGGALGCSPQPSTRSASPIEADGAAGLLAGVELGPLLEEILEEQAAPGMIVGLRRDGALGVEAAGLADLESGREIDASDPYFLGSVAKPYTATVVLQLVEEGRLTLDAPFGRWLPDFPGSDEITLRQLLGHTSGLADVAVWAYFRPDRDEMLELLLRDWTVDGLLEAAAALPPSFEPGTDWSYSNTNYTLLGAVVEAATGSTLAAETRRRILEPLGLESTWLHNWEPARGEIEVTGYLCELPFWSHSEMFGELGPTTPIDQGNMEWGSGGIVSTAEESMVFLDAVLDGDLLSEASLAEMTSWTTTPSLGAPSPETPADISSAYGFGIARQERPGYTMIGHGGLYNGHSAALWHIESCGTTVAFYVNRGFVDARWIMDRLAERLGCVEPGGPE